MKSLSSQSSRVSLPPIVSSRTSPRVASSHLGMQLSMITPGRHVAVNCCTAVQGTPPAVEGPAVMAIIYTHTYRKFAR
jgi:hypothetical protein